MKIICIGRNYAEHAKELNNEIPQEPVFFLKPDSAILSGNKPLFYPEFTSDLHYELELIVRINRLGKHIEEKFAHKYYDEIGLGIDFTARDIQSICKSKGLPWEKAKAFDGSAVIGDFLPKSTFSNLNAIDFKLVKNDKIVQQGCSNQMIFSIDAIIAYVSQFMTLKIGDILFTGTPSGVGAVKIGDYLKGYIGESQLLSLQIK